MLKCEVLAEAGWIDRFRDEWNPLLESSHFATPFQSLEWLEAWSGGLGRSKQPHVFTLREGSDLVAAYPLFRSRFPWRALRAIGTGVSDYLQPVVRSGYEDAFASEFASYVAGIEGVDLLDLHQVRENQSIASSFPKAEFSEQARCLVLTLPSTFDEYLAMLSKSLRNECKRLDKAPYSTSEAQIRTVTNPEEARSALDMLFHLHSARWKKRGLPGAFAFRATRDFHKSFAARAVGSGLLRLSLLEIGGEAVGAIYAMRTAGRYFFYQSGFNPEFKSHSPGSVLVAHTIRMAIEEGALEFDFLRGDEAYKRRWAPQRTFRNLRLLLSLNGSIGKAGHAINCAGGRIESKLRARLEGRGLLS